MSSFLSHEAVEATKHWPIVHDGAVGKFLRHTVEKKIGEARGRLERSPLDAVEKIQGELVALRWMEHILASQDIELFAKSQVTK